MRTPSALRQRAGRLARRVADRLAPPDAPPEPAGQTITLDYPVSPRARYGWEGEAAHPELASILDQRRHVYAAHLKQWAELRPELSRINHDPDPDDPAAPAWWNGWVPALDGVALYGFVATQRPALYVEVGSGNSTKFVRRAIEDHGLTTRIVSFDPAPRAEVDEICDEVIRAPFEEADHSVFGELAHGDVVFVDNSHRSFMNSDATVAIIEVMPRLPAGVVLGFHDIFIPADYAPDWADRWYAEQYLLAAFLLGGHRGYEIEMPTWYVSYDEELAGGILADLWAEPTLARALHEGVSFWMRRTADPEPVATTWTSPSEAAYRVADRARQNRF